MPGNNIGLFDSVAVRANEQLTVVYCVEKYEDIPSEAPENTE